MNFWDVEEGIELVINEGNCVVELKIKEDAELVEMFQFFF